MPGISRLFARWRTLATGTVRAPGCAGSAATPADGGSTANRAAAACSRRTVRPRERVSATGRRPVTARHRAACTGAFALACALAGVAAAAGPPAIGLAGRVGHPGLGELSGLARSDAHPGIFWAHNDSGNGPHVFALRADGSVHVPSFHEGGPATWPGTQVLDADNVDWEDIAIAGGVLYIAEMGNNFNARRDLGIYVVNEPDPDTGALRALRFLPVRYPEQSTYPAARWEFDCEALFVDGDALYLLTKHRHTGQPRGFRPGSHLYRTRGAASDRENVLERVSTHPDLLAVTAADLSPDGSKLAVLTYEKVWLFERPAGGGDDWFAGRARTAPMPVPESLPAEAIAWIDDATLLIGSENRNLYRARIDAFTPVR
jgi:hypothetical protein